MQCPKCGWSNADNAADCSNCFSQLTAPVGQSQPLQQVQQPLYEPQSGKPNAVQTHKTWAIVITAVSLLACNVFSLVLGIIAIVKTSSAATKTRVGDVVGSKNDTNTAMILNIIATALLCMGLLFAIPFWFGFFGALHGFGNAPKPGF